MGLSPPNIEARELRVDDSYTDIDNDGLCDDCSSTLAFSQLSKALTHAVCGDTVIVEAGTYDETISFQSAGVGNKACTSDAPLVIQAATPAVTSWNEAARGAGELHSLCNTTSGCDTNTISYVNSFNSWKDTQNSWITIQGFMTHQIFFNVSESTDLDSPTYTGCASCTFAQNFFYKNYRNCIRVNHSNETVFVGNHGFACGGDDSGDVAFHISDSARIQMHHNDIYGDGVANGDGFNDGVCNSSNWLTTCFEDFHGADGWTVHDTRVCGTRFYNNQIYDLRVNSDDNSDGDANDFKLIDCTTDPILIYDNEYSGQEAGQVIFHMGASGFYFFNNIIRDGLSDGITWQAGQECDGGNDYGYMHHFFVFNNLIYNNARHGIYLKHIGIDETDPDSCGTNDKRTLYDIHLFNNTVTQNGEHGLLITWIHDPCVAGETGECSQWSGALDTSAVQVHNNLFAGNQGGSDAIDVQIQNLYLDYLSFTHNLVQNSVKIINVTGGEDQTLAASAFSTNNLANDPVFSNASAFDFSLQSTSPAIDQGLVWSEFLSSTELAITIDTDLANSVRVNNVVDLGAYEFNSVAIDDQTETTANDDSNQSQDSDQDNVQDTTTAFSSGGGGCQLQRSDSGNAVKEFYTLSILLFGFGFLGIRKLSFAHNNI